MDIYTEDKRRHLEQFLAPGVSEIPEQIEVAHAVATVALSNIATPSPATDWRKSRPMATCRPLDGSKYGRSIFRKRPFPVLSMRPV